MRIPSQNEVEALTQDHMKTAFLLLLAAVPLLDLEGIAPVGRGGASSRLGFVLDRVSGLCLQTQVDN